MSCLPFPDLKPRALVDLFCLTYAGGSASVYRDWDDRFPDWVSVRPVEIPGRGARMGQPPLRDPQRLLALLCAEIAPRIARPWAVFGHSLGAAMGFNLAHDLRAAQPLLAYFPSGRHSATRRVPGRARAHLPDPDLIEEIRHLNGSPPEVLHNRELLSLVLPIIRADFALNEAVGHRDDVLDCPVHVFGGDADPEVPQADLVAWRDVAGHDFDVTVLPGDHFFLHHADRAETMRDRICAVLSRALARTAAVQPAETL